MAVSRSQVLARLTESARVGASEYANVYVELLPEIFEMQHSPDVFRGQVKARPSEARTALKVNLLYNDTCSLDVASSGEMVILWLVEEGIRRLSGSNELQLRVVDPQPDFIAACERGHVTLGFGQASDEETQQLLSDCAPLIEKGSVLPSPKRAIFYDTGEVTEEGGRHWAGLNVQGQSVHELWVIGSEAEKACDHTITSSVLDEIYGREGEQISLCNITLPYIDGVSMGDYARILEDEGDLLSEFRKEMRQLVSSLSEGERTVAEVRADVITPRVEKIGRRFKHIAGLSRMKVGGATVASTSLAMVAVAQGGPLAGLSAAAGGMGIWAVIKELADRSDKLHALKDDPLYLLWRLQARN